MKIPVLYRKRLIPAECLLLKDDIVLHRDEKTIVTKWNTIRPKKSLDHGYSCYLLDRGVKVSKFYDMENHLVCWYCDIVSHTYEKATDTYVFTDLLADVLVYPNGTFKVVDLDELADACDQGLLSPSLLSDTLRQLNWLLTQIYQGNFFSLGRLLEEQESLYANT